MSRSYTQRNESSETSVDSVLQTRNHMATRLIEPDRRAVDCILDAQSCEPGSGDSVPSFDPNAELRFQQRVATAQRWLALLGAMPSEDPSPDLIVNTLSRLDQLRASEAVSPMPQDTPTGARL